MNNKLLTGVVFGLIIGLVVGVLAAKSLGELKEKAAEKGDEMQQDAAQTGDKVGAGLSNAAGAASQAVTVNWTIPLGEQNNSGQVGVATLSEENGQTKVLLTMVNAPGAKLGDSQPAHIHLGACPNPGAVKYPLTNVVGDSSETILPITIAQLKTMLPLAINIHKSAAEVSVYTACGDLK